MYQKNPSGCACENKNKYKIMLNRISMSHLADIKMLLFIKIELFNLTNFLYRESSMKRYKKRQKFYEHCQRNE